MSAQEQDVSDFYKIFGGFCYQHRWRSFWDFDNAFEMGMEDDSFLTFLDWLESEVKSKLSDLMQCKALKKIDFLRRYGIRVVILGLPVSPKEYRCLLVRQIIEAISWATICFSLRDCEEAIKSESSETSIQSEGSKESLKTDPPSPEKKWRFINVAFTRVKPKAFDYKLFDGSIPLEPLQLLKFKYETLEEAISLDYTSPRRSANLLETYGIDLANMDTTMLEAKCFAMAIAILMEYSNYPYVEGMDFFSIPGMEKALALTKDLTVAIFKNTYDFHYSHFEHGIDKRHRRRNIRLQKIETTIKNAKSFFHSVVDKIKACIQPNDEYTGKEVVLFQWQLG